MSDRSNLRVTLVQQPLLWENIEGNLAFFTDKLSSLKGQTDLIILPEMFSTGFSMEVDKLAETMEGPTLSWMTKMARECDAVLTGSFICKEKNQFYNRLVWMYPDGNFQTYDKRHLFAYAGENDFYTAGSKKLILEWKTWRICPLICYDLRFPVWSRYTKSTPYDLLIFVANWPEKRRVHWQQLLIARAIENQCWLAGVNRVGEDGNGYNHAGDSVVINPLGETIYRAAHQAVIHTSTLSLTEVGEVRKRYRFLDDSDSFTLS